MNPSSIANRRFLIVCLLAFLFVPAVWATDCSKSISFGGPVDGWLDIVLHMPACDNKTYNWYLVTQDGYYLQPPLNGINYGWDQGDVTDHRDVSCYSPGNYTVGLRRGDTWITNSFHVGATKDSANASYDSERHKLVIDYDFGTTGAGGTAGFGDSPTTPPNQRVGWGPCPAVRGHCELDMGGPGCGLANTPNTRTIYMFFDSCHGEEVIPVKIQGECPRQQTECDCCGRPEVCVGQPVNVGSGDVSAKLPLFDIADPVMPLSFGLTYHSTVATYESVIPRPMGSDWTHSFNMNIAPVDANSDRLQFHTATGDRQFFDKVGTGRWNSARPSSSRDYVTIDGSDYLLVYFAGGASRFASSGRWLSTTDRWGNLIAGTYTNGQLTSITDARGRQVTLSYGSDRLTQVSLSNGSTWNFTYTNGILSGVRDPLHTGSSWRSFDYAADANNVARLLSNVRDDSGAVLESHTYDSIGRGTSATRANGQDSYTLEYDAPAERQTRVTHTINGSVNQTSVYSLVFVNGFYLPTRIQGGCTGCSSSGDDQSYTYDAEGRVLSMKDAAGRMTVYGYDAATGNKILQTDGFGSALERTTTFAYDDASWPSFQTKVTEPAVTGTGSLITEKSWNTGETVLTRSVTGREQVGAASPVTYTSTSTFDASHRLIATDGPRTDVADTSSLSYYADGDTDVNVRGRLHQVTDAVNLTSTYADYDVFGTPRTLTDPNGVVRASVTDGRGRALSSTNRAVPADANEATDYVQAMTYDSQDRMVSSTSARGLVTRFVYEAGTNRLTDTVRVDGSGNEVERHHVTLDSAGDTTRAEDQSCSTPSTTCSSWVTMRSEDFVYDEHHRLTEVDHPVPSGSKILYAYNADGTLLSVTNENGKVTTYAYDELKRTTSVSQQLGASAAVTGYGYDVRDHVTSITDPNGNVTAYTYDDFGRLLTELHTDAGSGNVWGSKGYGYDPAGNITAASEIGVLNSRTYDPANRPLSETSRFFSGDTVSLPESVSWTYDDATTDGYGKGRLATMSDPTGTTAYLYDRRGLLRSEQKTSPIALPNYGIPAQPYTTTYGFDADGNRTSIHYPSGTTAAYTVDYAGRGSSVSWGSTVLVSSAKYLPFGPQTEIVFGNGTKKTMAFDLRYRPLENKLALGGAAIADYNYTEDAVGNITAIADAVMPGYSRTFGYDDLNRLTQANTGPLLWGTGSYAYDAMGNMIDRALGGSVVPSSPSDPDSGSVTPARATHFDYVGPRVSAVTENGLLRSVTYDEHGNETSYIARRTYLPRHNLLWKIEDDGEGVDHHVVTYQYDGRGLRVVRTETPVADPNGWAAKRTFVYSPELQLLSVTADDRPNLWGKRAVTNDVFIPRYDLVYFAGQPVAQIDGATGAVRYTFTDHLGTPLLQTSATAAVIWQAEYEPFGNVWQMRTGSFSEQPLRFPGQDVATTWEGSEENYNIHRWYRSGWGRYTQADPLFGGRSTYSYADGNPSRYSDPLGLFTWFWGPGPQTSSDPRSDCGANTRVSCTTFRNVSLGCACQCRGESVWRPSITAMITVDMWVLPNSQIHAGMAADGSIHSAETAIDHEVRVHLTPAAERLRAWLHPLEKDMSKGECESTCTNVRRLNGVADGMFSNTLQQTQNGPDR